KLIKQLLVLLALLTLPAVAFAADGGSCSALQAQGEMKGQYREECFYICHGKIDTATACTEFDFQAQPHTGIPYKSRIELHAVAGCDDAYSIVVTQGSVSGGTEHGLVTLNAATTALVISPDWSLGRFLNVDIDNDTNDNCTDMTVIIKTYNPL
ncbi:unnamed protein product, partial [marine sediment metagenome]